MSEVYEVAKFLLNSSVGTTEFKPLDSLIKDNHEELENLNDYLVHKATSCKVGNSKTLTLLDTEKTTVAQEYLFGFVAPASGYMKISITMKCRDTYAMQLYYVSKFNKGVDYRIRILDEKPGSIYKTYTKEISVAQGEVYDIIVKGTLDGKCNNISISYDETQTNYYSVGSIKSIQRITNSTYDIKEFNISPVNTSKTIIKTTTRDTSAYLNSDRNVSCGAPNSDSTMCEVIEYY